MGERPADGVGGAVAALVAQAYPERVGRLVIEEPPPFPADPRRPDPVRTDEVLDYDWGVVVETDAQYNDPDPPNPLISPNRLLTRRLVMRSTGR
ncbi:hypothetical protein ABCR94_12185 [Streptomyces sp. 21So2-11]|uniref:hypothetical protein n=1 Tax=Streptomyces sp. 21So2-11 TaxID=3144408 RepID=UPI00321A86F5